MTTLDPYSYATAVTKVAYTRQDAQSYLAELGHAAVVGVDLEWNSKRAGPHRVDVVQVSTPTMVVIMHVANNHGAVYSA